MNEQLFVSSLLDTPIDFPWQKNNAIHYTTELKVTQNRVDIVFFERIGRRGVGMVIAVEAKIRDWKGALRQAYRNRLFADRVYVALPRKHASPAIENLSQFRETAVGLIVLDGDYARVYFHPPRNRSVSSWHADSVRNDLHALVSSK